MSKGQLQSWLDQDWVRLGADGSIKGSCGGRKEAEGKPKCIPRSKKLGNDRMKANYWARRDWDC